MYLSKTYNLYQEADHRILELEQIIRKLQPLVQEAPNGTLRISRCRGKEQYYHRENQHETYIRAANFDLAQVLACKDYYVKVIQAAQAELKILYEIREHLGTLPEQVYYDLSKSRQDLIVPLWLSDKEYADKWQNMTYERKPVSNDIPEYYTNRGERVRSKSEILIANQLDYMDRKYHYEKPLRLTSGEIIYPDFTILHEKTRKTVYLEHFGRMSDAEYVAVNMERLNKYIDSGIYPGVQLFITQETEGSPLNMRRLKAQLKAWLL